MIKKTPLLLIHGLYSAPWMLVVLKNLLEKKGFTCYTFKYTTTTYSEKTMQALHQNVLSICAKSNVSSVGLVGHSMGGLLSKNYFNKHSDKVKFIVTLGTPHNESVLGHIAKGLGILGTAGDSGITKKIQLSKEKPVPFLNIIGTMPFGPAQYAKASWFEPTVKKLSSKICPSYLDVMNKAMLTLFEKVNILTEPSDGTVFVSEALCEDATKQVFITASHMGLIFSKKVANEIFDFATIVA